MGSSFAIVLITLLWYPGGIDKDVDIHPVKTMEQCVKLRDSYLAGVSMLNEGGLPAFILNASAICLRLYSGERDQV